MTDSIPSIGDQPNQTLGIIMEAASALSSIGGGLEEARQQQQVAISMQQQEQQASEKPSEYDRQPSYDQERVTFSAYALQGTGENGYSKGLVGSEFAMSAANGTGDSKAERGENASPAPPAGSSEHFADHSADMLAKSTNNDPFGVGKELDGQAKRFLPDNKKPDAAPTFPEKLMKMMKYATGEAVSCVQWIDDGKSFVINQPENFTRDIVPLFFKPTKFSSFTRKLYRWGFRQVNRGIGPDDPIIFGNDFFQRDHEELICKMKSVTAASARKQDVPSSVNYIDQQALVGLKHVLELSNAEEQAAKRMMLTNQLYQAKADMMNMPAQQNPSMYGLMSAHGQLSLTNALRPGNIGGFQGNNQQQGLMQMQQQLNQQGMQMPMSMSSADNVHHQLLQLHQMQMLGQDGFQGHDGLAAPMDFQLQQQQQQLALQQQQQHQHQQAMSMQSQYSQQLGMSTQFQQQMNGGQQGMGNNNNNQSSLYDYIPQNAYSNPGSTVEIVNAAISALRYAN